MAEMSAVLPSGAQTDKPWYRRKWLLGQIALFVSAVALTLAGSYVIGTTHFGIFVIAGLLVLLIGTRVATSPALGLFLLVVFVYLNLSDVMKEAFGIPSLIRPLVGLMLISVIADQFIIKRKPIIFRTTEIMVLAYGLVILVSAFVAEDRSLAMDTFMDWIKDFLILLIIVQLGSEEKVWKRLHWMFIWCAGFLSLLTCIQMLSGNYDQTFLGLAQANLHQITSTYNDHRAMGPLDDPNFFAQILLMTVPLSTYRAFTDDSRRNRAIAAVILLLTAAAISFTYSRAAFIAACVVVLLVMREMRFNPIKIIVGVALVVLLLSPFLPKGYLDRLMTLNEVSTEGDMQTEASFRGRASESMVAVQMFLNHPLLGVGASNYSLNYQDYSSRLGIDSRAEARKAHNSYLQIAAEKGFIGLGVYIAMLVVLFVGLARARRQLRSIGRADLIPWVSAVQYSVASYLFTSFFLHDDYSRYLWMIVGLAAATTAMTESLVRQRNLSNSISVQYLSQRSGEVD